MSDLTYLLLVQKPGRGETEYHGKEEETAIDVEGHDASFTLKKGFACNDR